MADPVDVVRSDALTVSATTGRIVKLFETAPHKTFFHVRDTLGAIMGSHRREWLQKTDAKFHRGGIRSAPFGSKAGATAPGFQAEKTFFYLVEPRKKSVPRSQTPNLENISAESFTRSKVALGLETGGTFRARRGPFMAIPIGFALNKRGRPKAGFSSPTALEKHKRLVNKDTVVLRKPGEAPVIYLRKQLKRRVRLLPLWVLVRQVNRKPRLRYLATWKALDGDRTRRLARAMDRIVQELEQGRK